MENIKVHSDNSTTVQVINKMGSTHSIECSSIAQLIWQFCRKYDIWLTCAFLPGSQNKGADFESRKKYRDAEWMLNRSIFSDTVNHFNFFPDIDCFASRINCQLPSYISYKPDPFATYVDAFTVNWHKFKPYIFPPFNLISRILQKIRVDQTKTALCVFPKWPSQVWWPVMKKMMVTPPMIIPASKDNLMLPNKPTELHPLYQKMDLIICQLSGDTENGIKATQLLT